MNIAAAPAQLRCDSALIRLGIAADGGIKVTVLNDRTPTAYAYPSGRLYATHGLLHLADDDELAAALAHELGHLYDRGRLKPPSALTGRAPQHPDHESRADALAIQLLAGRGLATASLASLLNKIARHPGTAPRVREHLAQRLRILNAPEPLSLR